MSSVPAEARRQNLIGDPSPGADASEMELSLVAAMTAYQAGDLDAFETIYRFLLPRLRRYLSSLTLDRTLADDLVQEAFLQLHRSRHTYVPPRLVSPWAFGIARHVFLMDRRSGIRRARDRHDNLSEELPVPSTWERWAQRATVQRALAGLPEASREPLLLHHVWGFSFHEIGQLLGVRPGTVKVRAHRALHRLRDSIGDAA